MRTPLLLYALAIAVRALLLAGYADPAYPDSFYYVDVARALAGGRGLSVDFVWIFAEVGGRLPADPVLPIPSNAHWLPLASFAQAPFIAALGPTAVASALPLLMIGSLAAPLTFLIAREAGLSPLVQVGAGVLAAIPAAGTVFMAQPENFAIFEPLVAATLWLTARGLRGDGRSYALAGLLVGLASIARNDAFLLGGAVGLAWVIDRWRVARGRGTARISAAAVAACIGLYLAVVGPWWVRQLLEFGSISPTATGGTALWLTDYAQWNSITAEVTLDRFLARDLGAIIGSRVDGLLLALANFAVVVCSVVLVPLVALGSWLCRRSDAFLPWFVYFGVLLAGAMLLFPLHVRGGAYIHSAVGLAPHAYILALEGAVAGVGWLAARRPGWRAEPTARTVVTAIVAVTVGSAVLYAAAVQASWRADAAPRRALAEKLDRLGVRPDDRLMSIDAAGFKYFTGLGGVVTPNDPIETIDEVARAYDIRWLALERGATVIALEPVLAGNRPSWIGRPVFEVPAGDAGPPRLALYPVCVTTDDTRCEGSS